MKRRGFLNQLKNLPREKQMLGVVSLVAIVSCFLPWYGINSRVINEWWNAFGSIGSVAGYIVTGFAILTLALITFPALKPDTEIHQKLPFSESSILIFLTGQSFFTTLLFIPVYAQYSLINATNSGTRFGLYLALVSTLVGGIVAISYHQKVKKGALETESFASVPRTHRAVNEWEEEESSEYDLQGDEAVRQESMFQEREEETVTQSHERDIVADQSEQHFDEQDDYRNLYS